MKNKNTFDNERSEEISQLKSRIKELEETESRFKKLYTDLKKTDTLSKRIINTVSDYIILTDNNGIIIYVNDYMIQKSGYSRSEIEGKNALFFVTDKNIVKAENFARLVYKKQSEPEEFLLKMKNGKKILFEINGDVVRDKNGLLLYAIYICRDITKSRRMENLYLTSEEKFSKIFMTIPNCISISRMCDGFIFDTNYSFKETIGWNRNEATGHLSSEINFWKDPGERNFLIEELKAGRDVRNREFEFNSKNGEIRSGIYSAKSIRINNEECLILVIQDITAQKRMEQDKNILEQQLYHAQKMDAIGQLASGIAHDFNNILMGIQGNISLMQINSQLGKNDSHRLARIEESVKRGSSLTKQLLGFARKGKYESSLLSINDLISDSVSFFLETRKDIEAEFKLHSNPSIVEADRVQIEQVLLNLYINAAHAMPGGGKIYLETCDIFFHEAEATILNLKQGNYVKITVTDTGEGMNPEILKRVFEPFFTTKPPGEGTGLGLSSAYGIIHNHGGMITAHSDPGQGSTFNLYLPSSEKTVRINNNQKENPGIVKENSGILLVDDEQSILSSISELLDSLGYSVFKASCAYDAVDIYSKNHDRIQVVILDMIMPGMNGTELLQKLKEINANVRVIFSSGYSIQDDIQKILTEGRHGFIQKPYKIDKLVSNINQILNDTQ